MRRYLTLNNLAGAAICAIVAGFLIAVMYPVFLSARVAAKTSKSMGNLTEIGEAAGLFTQDFNYSLPDLHDARTMQIMLSPYVKDQSIFIDPHNHLPYQPNPALSHASLDSVSPGSAVIAYDQEPNNPLNCMVALLEGHGTRVRLQTLSESLQDKSAKYVLGPLVGDWRSSAAGNLRFSKDGAYQVGKSKGKVQWNADDVLHTPLSWLNGLVTWQTIDSFVLSSPKGAITFTRLKYGFKP